jgi:NAD(P)-dependent dehydrogenase (short-subunit alcohol dehydrogenase family)
MNLAGTCCLITGCSSGIGRAIALALASSGARVWASARWANSISDLESNQIRVVELDVTNPAAVSDVVCRIGEVEVLVNNAGYGLEGAVEEVGDEEFLEQYNTNVFGPWRLCRAVLLGMRERAKAGHLQM